MENVEMFTVLDRFEAKCYVKELRIFEFDEIGTKPWFRQHERIEKLNIEAARNAILVEEEFIKELLITYDKVAVCIHSLIMVECWKKEIFLIIFDSIDSQTVSFPISVVLQHLVTISGFLETVFFHCEVCESGGDYLIDLVDFCHRQLVTFIDRTSDEIVPGFELEFGVHLNTERLTKEELEAQSRKIDFQIGFKSISLLCHIVDHLQQLPLGIRNRLLCCHDTPMVLAHLLELTPWIKTHNEKTLRRFDGNKWEIVEDELEIDKTQGKMWVALYQLIQDKDNASKYDFNDFRKARLMKLRRLLHHITMDQLPFLEPLKRTFEELALHTPSFAKKDLVIEQSAVIYEALRFKWDGQWKRLAKHQMETLFNYSVEDMKQHATSLCEVYNIDRLDDLQRHDLEISKCIVCGKEANKRCSQCRNVWYCDKQCQVSHWSTHKLTCLMSKT